METQFPCASASSRCSVIATDNGMRPQGVRLVPVQNADALCDAIVEVANVRVQKSLLRHKPTRTNIEAVFHLYQEITNEG